MIFCYNMACIAPRCIFFSHKLKVKITFCFDSAQFKVNYSLFARCYVASKCSAAKLALIRALAPMKFIFIKICEHKLIFYFNYTA